MGGKCDNGILTFSASTFDLVAVFVVPTKSLYVKLSQYWSMYIVGIDAVFEGTPSLYVSSHTGQLSLLPSAGREQNTGQWPVAVLCD